MLKGAVASVQFTTVFLVKLLFILCHFTNALCNFQFLPFDKIGKSPKWKFKFLLTIGILSMLLLVM